jgi:hypothetical protein
MPSSSLQLDRCRAAMNSADSRLIHQASARFLLRPRFSESSRTCSSSCPMPTRPFDVASCLLSQAIWPGQDWSIFNTRRLS